MNVIKINVSFKKGFCTVDGIPLKTGDIESAKLVFDFDESRGEKFFGESFCLLKKVLVRY